MPRSRSCSPEHGPLTDPWEEVEPAAARANAAAAVRNMQLHLPGLQPARRPPTGRMPCSLSCSPEQGPLTDPWEEVEPAAARANAAAAVRNMPPGSMTHSVVQGSLPGHPDADGIITIDYLFAGGTQGPEHLRPGVPYSGTHRVAYLPNNAQGQLILRLLQKAFERKFTFTVGDDVTSGEQNTIVWSNDIPHKTSMHGGPQADGYPDPTYLQTVKRKLAWLLISEPFSSVKF